MTLRWGSSITLALGLPAWIACGADSRRVEQGLDDELRQAQLMPFAWLNDSGQIVPGTVNPSSRTGCALRLRDHKTGTEYVIQRSTKTLADTTAPDVPSSWVEEGHYLRDVPGGDPDLASHWVRIQCGSWNVRGLVPRHQ